jgi:hypothetical protein
MKPKLNLVLIPLAMLLTAQWVRAEIDINRSFAKITLGISIRELQSSYETKEIASSTLLPGERLFGIDGQFPGVHRVWCTFYRGKLFRVEVSYTPEFAKRVPWKNFVDPVRKKYGEGLSFASPQGQVIMWYDGKTSFILERKGGGKSPTVYEITLADDELSNARQEVCPRKDLRV